MPTKTRKISGRFITISIPDTIFTKEMYTKHILAVLKKHNAKSNKCVKAGKYGDFSESEHKFTSIVKAKAAIKDLKAHLKENGFVVGEDIFNTIIIRLMPSDYERTGSRGIVRPDSFHLPGITYKKC
jgi:hypothetical protein